MTLGESWVPTQMVIALGWALVHFAWQGALIALLLAAVLRVCRGARLRYGAACIAMLAMLAAFAITAAVSVPGPMTAEPLPWTLAAGGDPGAAAAMADRSLGIRARILGALPSVVLCWISGAILIGFYRFGGWLAARRMRRQGVCAASPEWQERLGYLARRIGVSKPIVLLESSLAGAPVVFGLFKPVILIPAGLLTGLSRHHLEAILLHELAHIRRLDYLVNLVQTLVESLLFYHPAVWWISRLIRAERENCCDDAVLAAHGDARSYAEALVTLEERRLAGLEPALAATGGHLMKRIRRLLNQPEEPRSATALVIVICLLLGSICFFAAAQQPEQNVEMPFAKWLREDVVYIIADEERAAFERLPTNEEREHFIEQFWQRRDPTPGTQKNEFKEEHYRRIAYANDRFVSSVPGWRTDRGRVYIIHGPPDEIESHPRKGVELWRYRRIDGIGEQVIFEFTDPQLSGEYRLTKDPTPAR